jgi:hypothetical protein
VFRGRGRGVGRSYKKNLLIKTQLNTKLGYILFALLQPRVTLYPKFDENLNGFSTWTFNYYLTFNCNWFFSLFQVENARTYFSLSKINLFINPFQIKNFPWNIYFWLTFVWTISSKVFFEVCANPWSTLEVYIIFETAGSKFSFHQKQIILSCCGSSVEVICVPGSPPGRVLDP